MVVDIPSMLNSPEKPEILIPLSVLVAEIYREIKENYDVPANLQPKHLRLYFPAMNYQTQYTELVCYEFLPKNRSIDNE